MPIPCAGTAASASCSARITLSAGPIFHCYCCPLPSNVLRTLASLHEWAYGQNEGELRVCLYGSSEARADVGAERAFHVQQRTQYPWDGEVTRTVREAPSAPVALALRIPAWAGGATVAVNGDAPRTRPRARSAATRAWRTGDEVRLPLRTRRMAAHPKLKEARNQVAFARGPIVYCAETADLDGIESISELYVARDAELTPRREQGALGDIVALRRAGLRLPSAPASLYAAMEAVAPQSVALTLIPYYAWNNRGRGRMSAWLPLYG